VTSNEPFDISANQPNKAFAIFNKLEHFITNR